MLANSKICGIAFCNIVLGGNTISRMNINFVIDLKAREFDFNVENITGCEFFDYYYFSKDDADRVDFIFGIDANDIPFTLYGCSICHLNFPVKQMRIVWNSIIIGKHIPIKSDYTVKKLRCIVEDSKKKYRLSVGRNEYKIASNTITVKTDWSRAEGGKFNGVVFELFSETSIQLEKMEEFFYRLLEMHFFWIGYFPEIKEMRYSGETEDLIYAEHTKGIHQSKSSNVSLERRMFLKNMDNFSDKFDKWVVMRSENIPVFTVFQNGLYSRDMFEEVKTSTLIQCLEGYFTTHHKSKMIIYSKKQNKLILDVVETALNTSEEIADSFERELLAEIVASIKGNLGRINRKSLKKIILFAIEHPPHGSDVFAYEKGRYLREDKTYLDEFVAKAVNHRNFISHLFRTDEYFKEEENKLAIEKIILLLRLCFLYDIGLEVTKESVDSCIDAINRRYYGKNNLQVSNPRGRRR